MVGLRLYMMMDEGRDDDERKHPWRFDLRSEREHFCLLGVGLSDRVDWYT